MREEIERINRMVSKKTISPEQGERLINALPQAIRRRDRRCRLRRVAMFVIEVCVISIVAIIVYTFIKG